MNQTLAKTKSDFLIHPRTQMGSVSLTVANLDNQIEFYQKAMGFKLHWKENGKAGLGAGGKDLLLLTEEPNVKKYRGVTGLYHVAYLFPNRRELAIAIGRLFALKYPNSPTDHIMTKTTYLDDLEHNGIELYCESPEDGTWTFKDGKYETYRKDGSWSDGREALDLDELFSHLTEDDKLDVSVPPELKIGHVHLHVRDVDEAVEFYHGVLGFDIMGVSKPFQMGFVSAGGYHHHLGLNTWQGRGAPPPPPDAVGLRFFTIELPNQQAYDDVVVRVDKAGISLNQIDEGLLLYDPSQNGVVLTVA
ncbi:MAG: VOC family protein [Anaerolineales bacterium]|nr:VOC family protein [Anaerolineales bacterium]MCL4259994.1 VOC family protein [Anaerolineales bacterium]